MGRFLAVCVATLLLASPHAEAQEITASRSPSRAEPGIVLGQLGLGFLTTTMTLAGGVTLADELGPRSGSASSPMPGQPPPPPEMTSRVPSNVVFAATLAVDPLLTGLVVCKIGQLSSSFHGRCLAPMVAATVTAGVSVGLGFAVGSGCSGDLGCGVGAALLLIGGMLVGVPVAATVAWHVYKEPNSTAIAAEGRATPTTDDAPGWHLSLPLMSRRF